MEQEKLALTYNIDQYDIADAERVLEDLAGWLMNHTTEFGAAALILNGAIHEIQAAKQALAANNTEDDE